MGWLSTLERPALAPVASSASALDDFYYRPVATISASGLPIDESTAMRIATYFRCKAVLADAVGMLPLHVYRRLAGGGKERASDLPTYRLLHDKPNGYQTPIEFKGEQMHSLMSGGNAMSLKRPGVTGDIEELWPLEPERTEIKVMADRTVRFLYREWDSTQSVFTADQVWHVKRWARNGVGISLLGHARDSLGLTLALETHANATFRNGAKPGGVVEHPLKLSGDAMKQWIAKWNLSHQGAQNAGKVTILDEGAKFVGVGMNNDDAQLLAMRQFQREDVAAWFGVPPHLLGYLTKETSWGSGIEQLSLLFLIYTLLPWLVVWEQSATLEFLPPDGGFFAEFMPDALLRGDTLSRAEAMSKQVMSGILAPNEGRAAENRNPLPGGDGLLLPVNMVPAEKLGQAQPAGAPPTTPATPPPGRQATALLPFLRDAAARVARKESARMGATARRVGTDVEAWRTAVTEFYAEHGVSVAESLHLRPETAHWYQAHQEQTLLDLGPDFAQIEATWEARATEYLTGLALTDHGMGDYGEGAH